MILKILIAAAVVDAGIVQANAADEFAAEARGEGYFRRIQIRPITEFPVAIQRVVGSTSPL